MLANNETGTLQDVKRCVKIAKNRGVLVHCDAVQVIGKLPVDVMDLQVDLLTLSAHKIYGPKGVGALYIGKGISLDTLINGGGQESGLRSGTENVLEIVGFGKAAELALRYAKEMDRIHVLRDHLESGIKSIVKDYKLNGHSSCRLPNTLNVTLPNFRGESLVTEMNRRGVCFSSGSACHSGSSAPSTTLLAMGLTEEEAHCSVRFSLGFNTTRKDIDLVIKHLKGVIDGSQNFIRFVSCK
jgi:cysteine sulfinate desulfinase/cysteine desulfurase-like protein